MSPKNRAIDLKPAQGQMLKPAELLELRGVGHLTLQDRRIFNALVENAWGPKLGRADVWFSIETARLREYSPRTDRLADSVERLMQTLALTVKGDEEERTQLLGSTRLKTTVNGGTLTYRFTPELVALLKEASIFAKLDLAVMRGFGSRYAYSLYEQTARRVRLQHKITEMLTLEELRQLLGVEGGKLTEFKSLNARAIQPAVAEVNAISPWSVVILPVKDGKKVTAVMYGWSVKDTTGQKAAYAELQRHRTGRKHRLDGTAEPIADDEKTEPQE